MAKRFIIDKDGQVVSIQRRIIYAPDFCLQPGDAQRWFDAYWRLVTFATLGLITSRTKPDGFALELRGVGLPVLSFGKPYLIESDRFIAWALSLQGGLLNGGTAGFFICAAERRGDRWYCTMMLREFVPRLALLSPRFMWRPFYCLTQGLIHHLLGTIYLFSQEQIARQGDKVTR